MDFLFLLSFFAKKDKESRFIKGFLLLVAVFVLIQERGVQWQQNPNLVWFLKGTLISFLSIVSKRTKVHDLVYNNYKILFLFFLLFGGLFGSLIQKIFSDVRWFRFFLILTMRKIWKFSLINKRNYIGQGMACKNTFQNLVNLVHSRTLFSTHMSTRKSLSFAERRHSEGIQLTKILSPCSQKNSSLPLTTRKLIHAIR